LALPVVFIEPMTRAPPSEAETRRAALGGLIAGLVASTLGLGYLADVLTGPYAWVSDQISWARVGAVFVAELALTGAAVAAAVHAATKALDARGGRGGHGRMLAASAATSAVTLPAGVFGAWYFGSLHAPYMGNSLVLAVPFVLAVLVATWLAWLDVRRVRAPLLASVGCALPLAVVVALVSRSVTDEATLDAMHTHSLASLGAVGGAGGGALFGLYIGLVSRLVRGRAAGGASSIRVAARDRDEHAGAHAGERKERELPDPLAEEEAELEARFAELDRAEKG
jgi:hypothetical protein